jgi:enoyl-CoA hydratase
MSLPSDDVVSVERRADRVAVLTLNRPDRLNALSSAVASALARNVSELASDDRVGALVVSGAGRAFCAGADITELDTLDSPQDFSAFVSTLTDALRALARCPKPSVAAIHGLALGGGLELALSCDLRVADESAKLGVPEIKLGLLPGATGTARLTRLLPTAIAKQLLLTGEPLTASDALRHGLVNDVVATGGALEAAIEVAARLAALPPLALSAAKRLVDDGAFMPFESAVMLERETVSMLFGTADRVEGVRAFLEKRSPTFHGR